MSKKYERKRVDAFSIPFELFDDALADLNDQQLAQVIRAERKYAEAEANDAEFEQPELDPQAKLAFNLLKRHTGYSNQQRKRNNFSAKYNKDFGRGDKIPPETITKSYTPEELKEMGYYDDEIAWIREKEKAYDAKVRAAETRQTKSRTKEVTESKYDQRENAEPDGDQMPQWLVDQMKKQAQ